MICTQGSINMAVHHMRRGTPDWIPPPPPTLDQSDHSGSLYVVNRSHVGRWKGATGASALSMQIGPFYLYIVHRTS